MESEPIIVGARGTGGLSVKGHVPEKTASLACLLMAELVATRKKSLGQILKELSKQIGDFTQTESMVSFRAGKKRRAARQTRQWIKKHWFVQSGKIHHN